MNGTDFKSPQFFPTPNLLQNGKIWLIGLSKKELEIEMEKIGEKPFKAKQIWNWIYAKGVKNFSEMSNISFDTRKKLETHYSIERPQISQDLLSSDGTRKWLVKFSDCKEVEMVFIPEEDRGTLCISSQIGCTLTCKFCHTGTQLLVRNLSAGEIVAQLMLARDLLVDWGHMFPIFKGETNSCGSDDLSEQNRTMRTKDTKRKVTSLVFMGMGEPLYNYDNVKKAVQILNDPDGINFSRRKITISTSGVVPEILKFSDEIKTVLAISLHATNDETRSRIMPLNKKYSLDELIKSLEYYVQKNPGARITFEYVTLKGINDSDEDAKNFVKLLKTHKLPALINLIPFNPWNGSEFECSSRNRIMAFGKIIKDSGYTVTIRKTRGQDVMAACGQLKSASQRERKLHH